MRRAPFHAKTDTMFEAAATALFLVGLAVQLVLVVCVSIQFVVLHQAAKSTKQARFNLMSALDDLKAAADKLTAAANAAGSVLDQIASFVKNSGETVSAADVKTVAGNISGAADVLKAHADAAAAVLAPAPAPTTDVPPAQPADAAVHAIG